MPHFGLMNPNKMSEEEAALMRAKLHIRGGKRRLRQGKVSSGIVTLYDALTYAMQWYLASPERRQNLTIKEGENIKDDHAAAAILSRSGVLGEGFDYGAIDNLAEKVLEEEGEMPGYDYTEFLKTVESAMTRLGVMPFDESTLPPEDPKTY
jgi:hypothetical protein